MLTGESVDDTVLTLGDVREWRLPERRWPLVHDRLERIAAAARAGDGSALARATAALQLLSPVRATRLGTEPVVPPPPGVDELVNETVDSLRGSARRGEEGDVRAED